MNGLALINTFRVHAAAFTASRGRTLLLSAPGWQARFRLDPIANHSSIRAKIGSSSQRPTCFCLPSGVFRLPVFPPDALRQKIQKA